MTLLTADGVELHTVHRPGPDQEHVVVVAHGFTLSTAKPGAVKVIDHLAQHVGVLAYDARGHGRSGGLSTVGDREVLDLDAVLAEARRLGHARVTTLGFSMGGSVVLRHAGLRGQVVHGHRLQQAADAVVAVSAPSRWYVRDTASMRRVHRAIESRGGRFVARRLLGTRIDGAGWAVVPDSPIELVHAIAPVPLLLVQGDSDSYFGVEHGHALARASQGHAELWVEPGFAHAENATTTALLDRVLAWSSRVTAA